MCAALVPSAAFAEQAIIVLDGSGSMWGQIDGKNKIVIAKETVGTVLQSFPAERELGLIAYGHREKGNCADIEELVPVGSATAGAIADAVNGINPKGKTPLSASVKLAAEKLRYTEEKATVVLITDGLETCEADPCALANELEQAGIDFTAHVVGFGLTEEEGRQVACIAENTGGIYKQATDAGALAEALQETVVAQATEPEPEPEPKPAELEVNLLLNAELAEGQDEDIESARFEIIPLINGEPVGGSTVRFGDKLKEKLEPGSYDITLSAGRAETITRVEVTADQLVERDMILNAGIVEVRVLDSEGGAKVDDARWTVDPANAAALTGYNGGQPVIIPAGPFSVEVNNGRAAASTSGQVAAGATELVEIVAAAGIAKPRVVYAPGGPVVSDGLRIDIMKAKMDLQGNREAVQTSYTNEDQFLVPPGDYVIVAYAGSATAEVPVTVSANEMSPVDVVLNAGVAFLNVPGLRSLEIQDAAPNIEGNRQRYTTSYNEETTYVLPAGEYRAYVYYPEDGGEKEQAFTVVAGQRVEVSVTQ
ncbi:MAG: VWA domain-containing protein [Pseudomonadota bacterium]